jgi:hypothetical protein
MRTRLGLASVAALLALAACGEDPAPAPPAAGGPTTTAGASAGPGGLPDPCTLLTEAELSAATGDTYGPGVPAPGLSNETISACEWSGPDIDTVQVLVSSMDSFEQSREVNVDTYGGVEDVDIAGADRAYAVAGGFLIAMTVGDLYVQVSLIADGDPAKATRELAGKVAGRL